MALPLTTGLAAPKAAAKLATRVDEALRGVHRDYMPLIDRKLLQKALAAIDALGDTNSLMPALGLIFAWLRECGGIDDLVGGICGQDPYPTGAIGVCFGKYKKDGLAESFKPIVKCLQKQGLMRERKSQHADIRPYVVQGLLAFNMALTTREGCSKVHQAIWKPFMQGLVRSICREAAARGNKLFFLLWGNEARDGVGAIAKSAGHVVFVWTHPSPLADNKLPEISKFANCTNFAEANAHLKAVGKRPFVWDNMGLCMAFTDGACSGNGKASATGGYAALVVGSQFGQSIARGVVAPNTYALVDPAKPELGFAPTDTTTPVTNNRAELLGLCWAFLLLVRGYAFGEIDVRSDSKISVQTLNEWLPARRRKGTAAQSASKLANMDLLTIAETLMKIVKERCIRLSLLHVLASHDNPLAKGASSRDRVIWSGNNKADLLAKGARDDSIAQEISSPLYTIRALCGSVEPETDPPADAKGEVGILFAHDPSTNEDPREDADDAPPPAPADTPAPLSKKSAPLAANASKESAGMAAVEASTVDASGSSGEPDGLLDEFLD